MARDLRLALSVQVLALLARNEENPCPSQWLADQLNTHRGVIRRLLGGLTSAGMIEGSGGRAGGIRLIKDLNKISIADVCTAVNCSPDGLAAGDDAGIAAALSKHLLGSRKAMLRYLQTISVADVVKGTATNRR